MKPLHKIVLVLTTFVLAAATGHVMQTTDGSGRGAGAPTDMAALGLRNIEPVANLPPNSAPAQTAQRPPHRPPQLATPPMRSPQPGLPLGPLPVEPPQEGFTLAQTGCAAPQLAAQPGPMASVRLVLSAPCLGAGPATIRHHGLALPITLSAQGGWAGGVPAMAEQAEFTVDLADGQSLSAALTVPGLEGIEQIALVSRGATPMRLAGPVEGGWSAIFATANGDEQVQIYATPAGKNDLPLMLEAPVTAESCGQDLSARVVRVARGRADPPAEITLAMPPCDGATGAVLMPLPNPSMTLAAN